MHRSALFLELAACASTLKKTALFDLHLEHKAHMAPFAGYEMPIYYNETGVIKEHLKTRSDAGLFDVSHMGQYEIRGADRERFMEWVTPVDLKKLPVNNASLSIIMNANGGIKDDCIVTKCNDHLFLVLNAGCKEKDVAHLQQMKKEFNGDVHLIPLQNRSLLALQGPKSSSILAKYIHNVQEINFMESTLESTINNIKVRVSRCGYTGEDGFEISVADNDAAALAAIFINEGATLIGLGARDTLRLEAGLNLYGHELSEETNPIAAKLMWNISKRRMNEGGFIGYEKVKLFKSDPEKYAPQLKVGLQVGKGPVAREQTIIEKDGKVVGKLTSGGYSPCLKHGIGLGYVNRDVSKIGNRFKLVVRDTRVDAEIVPVPFVPTKYYRKQ